MKISINTKPVRAGAQMGKAIIEMVHLLYLKKNAKGFLKAIIHTLRIELERRIKEE